MQLDDFDFELPESHIALTPHPKRDGSKVLRVHSSGQLEDLIFRDLPQYFAKGDVLVLNDSRVIPAALKGVRYRDEFSAHVHVNLHKQISSHEWLAFAKPAKRLKPGDRIRFGEQDHNICMMGMLDATVCQMPDQISARGGEVMLRFDVAGSMLEDALLQHGEMPLPPYIASKRGADETDKENYQTVYAAHDGSVAAPTAGLHFTDLLLEAFREAGVVIEFVTLHVGAGTFLPVTVDDVSQHKMHAEWGSVGEGCVEAISKAQADGQRVCSVGTTSLRLLESAARETGIIQPWTGETDIFITPGFQFHVVDRLITNFHLPRSTLFMLVAAFSGLDVMQSAYQAAIARDYRFYSYGDACLLEGKRA